MILLIEKSVKKISAKDTTKRKRSKENEN